MDACRRATVVLLIGCGLGVPSPAVAGSAAEKRGRIDPRTETESPARESNGNRQAVACSANLNSGLRVSRRFDLHWDGRAHDAGKTVTVAAGEAVEARPAHDDPAQRDHVVELRGDVHLQIPDESMAAKADRAVVTVRYQDASKMIVESLTVKLSGRAQWTSDGISASADRLTLYFRPWAQAKATNPRQTDWTVTGRARVNGKDFVAQADQVELSRDMDDIERPVRVKLEGNAALKYGNGSAKAGKIEFRPSSHEVRVSNLRE